MKDNKKEYLGRGRVSSLKRKTKETDIEISLNLDSNIQSKIDTSISFLDHLLENFAKHGLFSINLKARGDIQNGQHHLVEDTGIVLGQAFDKALKDRAQISRAGYFVFPMDESLSFAAIDISGRPYLDFEAKFNNKNIAGLESSLIEDFFIGFTSSIKASMHLRLIKGRNDHHKAESLFKALGRAMHAACETNKKITIQSTKGVI